MPGRITVPPSKRPTSLLMFGKPSSSPSSSLSPSPKLDSSLNVPEYPVPVNHSTTFSAPLPSSLSKEEKVIDATSINHLDTATSTAPSLVPLLDKQQQDSEIVVTSVGPVQGNDTCRMRCPALPVLKEGKMIDISAVNCQVLNPPGQYCHEGTQHLCDLPLDTSNTEVAKAPSQLRSPLLEAPLPAMPTTIHVVPLELPQVQQSADVINVPCAMLDIQGNDTGHHLRSSTASISKEGKMVDVHRINDLALNTSSLRCNLSLRTSDILPRLPPQLKPPLLEALIPTMPMSPVAVVLPSDEQQAAVLVAVHQNDNRHVKPSGALKVQQSLKEGKVSDAFLQSCRHPQCRHYRPRARRSHSRQHHCRYYSRRPHCCKGAPHLCKTSSWSNASQSIMEADTPVIVIPATNWNGNGSVICQAQPLKEGKVSDTILQTCQRCHPC